MATHRGGGEAAASRPRRLGATLGGYVARSIVVPTVLALAGLTAAILTKDLLGFTDLVLNRGLGAADVVQIALYELLPLVSYTLPLAVLIGTLAGLGRLRGDLELLAAESAGIAPARLALPVLAFAAVAAVGNLMLTAEGAPWARRQLSAAIQEMAFAHPGQSIRAGVVQEFAKRQLLAREVSSDGQRLRGVLLWEPEAGEAVFAREATLAAGGRDRIRLTLRDGTILRSPGEGAQEIRFEVSQATLDRPPPRLRGGAADPLQAVEISALRRMLFSAGAEGGSAARAEMGRRLALPVACLALGLLGVPLALAGVRSSGASGAVVGLLAIVAYYGLLQLGSVLAHGGVLPVGLGAWLPNLIALGGALGMLWIQHRDVQMPRPRVGRALRARPETGTKERDSLRPRSRPLDRYLARSYLGLAALCFAALVLAYLVIDVLERLSWFLEHQASAVDTLRFFAARTPRLASRMLPMGLLAAAALGVARLGRRGELVGMQACGIRLARGLAPIAAVALLAVPLHFAFDEFVVPRSNAVYHRIRVIEIGGRTPLHDKRIWYRQGEQLVLADLLGPRAASARDLTIYELDDQGLPLLRTDAERARYAGGGVWELEGARRIAIGDRMPRVVKAPRHVALGPVGPRDDDPDRMSARQLSHEIARLESAGYDATHHRVALQMRLAAPLACALLPLVALLGAIGIHPVPGPARNFLRAALLGVGYVLLVAAAASLGFGGTLEPALAGWGPVGLLAAAAAGLWLRTRS